MKQDTRTINEVQLQNELRKSNLQPKTTLIPNIADATLDDELPNYITLFELRDDLPEL